MNKRIIGFIVGVVVVIGAIVGFNIYNNSKNTISSNNSTTSTSSTKVKKNGKTTTTGFNDKVLIVYFSRKKAVYGGDLTLLELLNSFKKRLKAILTKLFQKKLILMIMMKPLR